jgi:hypothetical protein
VVEKGRVEPGWIMWELATETGADGDGGRWEVEGNSPPLTKASLMRSFTWCGGGGLRRGRGRRAERDKMLG